MSVERIDRPQVLITGTPPEYQNPGDAGMDLVSTETVTLEPGARVLVPTGVSIALPQGYVGLVTPRSGLALKHGISMVNSPGVIDAGYRGEIGLILWNTDLSNAFTINEGDRIGQLLIMRVAEAQMIQVDSLPGSSRGMGGFGSTDLVDAHFFEMYWRIRYFVINERIARIESHDVMILDVDEGRMAIYHRHSEVVVES